MELNHILTFCWVFFSFGITNNFWHLSHVAKRELHHNLHGKLCKQRRGEKNTTLPTRAEQTRCLSQDNEPGGAARARPSACSPVSRALTDSCVCASSLGREKGRHESGTRQLITSLQDARRERKVTHKNTRPPPAPNALHYRLPFTGAHRAAGDVTVHLRHESVLADGASARNAPGKRRKMLTWATTRNFCAARCAG